MFKLIVLLVINFLFVRAAILSEECVPTITMIDASAKIPAGVLSGNLMELGSFDQCLKIRKPIVNSTETIRGKYCLMKIAPRQSIPNTKLTLNNFQLDNLYLRKPEGRVILQSTDGTGGIVLGWCIPENCDPEVLASNLTSSIFAKLLKIQVKTVMGGACQIEDNLTSKMTDADWGAIGFLIFIGTIIIASTLYDVYLHFAEKRTAHLVLVAFSLKTNSEKLFKVSKNSGQIECLHGIRFISMMWVVLGHFYSAIYTLPITNILDAFEWLQNGWNMYIQNAYLAVDTFFVLSGFLVCYGFCVAKSKGVKFNIILFYIHRYLRLTPVVAVVIFISATLVVHFGNGPLWHLITNYMTENCISHWWTPLVYINNYYDINAQCLGQTWYLAVDFQLYLISPLILIPLWKWPKKTMIVLCVLLIGSVIIPFAITYHFDISQRSNDPVKSQQYMKYYYYATHARYGPWLMGLMLGYYIFKLKKEEKENGGKVQRLDAVGVIFGWVTSLTIMLVCLFAADRLLLKSERLEMSLFNALHRHGWSLGLCWVIYACILGYGGVVNSFLSWSAFQVLGRLTYTVYLVHLAVISLIIASTRTSTYFSNFNFMYDFWGDFMISLGVAICLTLSFESPMITIEKIIFSLGKTKKETLPTYISRNDQILQREEETRRVD